MANERLKELSAAHEKLVEKLNAEKEDSERLLLWRSITLNLKAQNEILNEQVENLKKQIR